MQSKIKMRQATITGGLGLACLGLGTMFALFPGFMNRAAGFNLANGREGKAVIRLVGMRDVAFGLGLLLTRDKPQIARTWLQLLALIAGSDILALGLSLPGSKSKLKTLLGMSSSAAITAAALVNSRDSL